ncbi:hypothetical protein CRG98_050230 [Punica granatum]|uniref:Uncharacterized protein n=1 Tax=Punica granatum TaxID=22663 RepID=A0A2I0GK23_PUNGR|nr:hypothetical protein CRG98_050230 [Punica granatum]
MARNIDRELQNLAVEDRELRAQVDRVITKFHGLMNLVVAFSEGGSIVHAHNSTFHCQQVAKMIIPWIVVLSVGATLSLHPLREDCRS